MKKRVVESTKKNAFIAYLKSVSSEMKKVHWPKKDEVIQGVVEVLIFVVIMSFFLGILDLVLKKGIFYVFS